MNKIGIFELDQTKTTMKYGYHYKASLPTPFCNNERMIRVWLPESYFNDTIDYPVMYFSDGQNLVNNYLTAFGDWKLDQVVHDINIPIIAVGIDSPNDDKTRTNELTPPFEAKYKDIDNPCADKFVEFIVNTLKPIIDKTFKTKKDKANTGIAGSSMGGLMSFYGALNYSETFGFALVFSPAFKVFTKNQWEKVCDSLDITPKKNIKFFFFVGGVDFEKEFVKSTFITYKYLEQKGFDNTNLAIIHDSRLIHHEDSWNKYLGEGIRFWLLK